MDEPAVQTASATWMLACPIDELEQFWGEAVLLEGTQLALFKISDTEVLATSNQDPHTGAFVMARGIVGSRGESITIASPLHKEIYDLRTGEGLSHPQWALAVYETRIVDGQIEVKVSR